MFVINPFVSPETFGKWNTSKHRKFSFLTPLHKLENFWEIHKIFILAFIPWTSASFAGVHLIEVIKYQAQTNATLDIMIAVWCFVGKLFSVETWLNFGQGTQSFIQLEKWAKGGGYLKFEAYLMLRSVYCFILPKTSCVGRVSRGVQRC